MLVRKIDDCSKTDPPSTAFAVMIDTESPGDSEAAFVAELCDLITANRTEETMKAAGITNEQQISAVKDKAQTPRVMVSSLATQVFHNPHTTVDYRLSILNLLETEWQLPHEVLLHKAFFIRIFWF